VSTVSPAKAESQLPKVGFEVRIIEPRSLTLRHNLEEQVGLLAAHRQIADLVDDQQPVGIDRAMHDLAITALTLGGLQASAPDPRRRRRESCIPSA